ncbi:hypothetical protein RZM60_004240, partial [Pseudomonas aeruginosa]|nr:hypothetical protein [Pseudomonas aeruginosa]
KAERDAALVRVAELEAELETERMRLSACATAALGYFDGCADAYKSASLSDVLRLRGDCDAALAEIAELEKKLAMALDAASKGDAARHAAGGMEMEIRELKAKLAELEKQTPVKLPARARHSSDDEYMQLHEASVAAWNSCLDEVGKLGPLYAAPVAPTLPEDVRVLLSRAQAEIEHLAEYLENVCEDDEELDVAEDIKESVAVAEKIAHLIATAPVSKTAAPAQAQHSVPAYVSYTTQPAESLAGIALRQLKDESRWVEIRDINAHAFPDMRSHSYYPAGTVIKLPAAAPGKEGV